LFFGILQYNVEMRKILIAANWKMNILPSETRSLAIAATDLEWPDFVEVLICPPFTHLTHLQSLLEDGVRIGAQNCHEKRSGAYTGEVSAEMLKDLKCQYVILGHSERRAANPNEQSNLKEKIVTAIQSGLKVIYCCGETLEIREKNQEKEFVSTQLKTDLFHLEDSMIHNVSIAYEPVWAIGTGKHATAEQAQEMHHVIRMCLAEHFSKDKVDNLSVLYGGSVNAANVQGFSRMPDIDGVLVGGASLKPEEFKMIIKTFAEAKI
jgi:triosephosphate isomerase (TIM)